MITAKEIIAQAVCPHTPYNDFCADCTNDPSQLSYPMGVLAQLTHSTQVEIFNWCGCEEGERQYDDCPTRQ